LKFSEKWQSARAGILFACTPNMNDYIIKNFRNDLSSKIIYKPACVDLNNFDYTRYDLAKIKLKYYKCDDIVCVYAGKFGGIYLEDEIFHFISLAYKFWCNKFKFLLLSNASSDYIVSKCNLHRIPYEIIDQFFVPHDQMPLYLARADFALSPIMQVPSKKFCSPIKNSEYFAMGLPILISDGISIDSDIIKKKSFGYVMPEWNSEYILKAIMYFDSYLNLSNKDKIRESIRNLAIRERSFLLARKAYSKYYKIEP
jgi:glycosyltransferase involved in cell wall biosynthesis